MESRTATAATSRVSGKRETMASLKDITRVSATFTTETGENFDTSHRFAVVEPDGSIREVDYTADSKNGFNAVVKTVSDDKY
jgi:Insect cuticle protein